LGILTIYKQVKTGGLKGLAPTLVGLILSALLNAISFISCMLSTDLLLLGTDVLLVWRVGENVIKHNIKQNAFAYT
jgi:hypothetical protein